MRKAAGRKFEHVLELSLTTLTDGEVGGHPPAVYDSLVWRRIFFSFSSDNAVNHPNHLPSVQILTSHLFHLSFRHRRLGHG